MKRVKNTIIALFSSIILFTSCNREFLDRFPLDSPSSSTFFSNETELTLAVNSAYRSLLWLSSHEVPYIMWLDGSTDMTWTRGDYVDMLSLQSGNVTTETSVFYDTWNFYYNSIMRCNNILQHMHRAQENVSPEFYNQTEAQAKFLRAWNYSFLISLYGDVPLVTTMLELDDAYAGRAVKSDVLTLIFDDLDFAAAHLPVRWDEADNGRATRGAALTLKARIALYEEEYEIASRAAKEVMDLGEYSLYADYENLFKRAGSGSSEAILSLPFVLNFQTSQIPRYLGTRTAPGYAILVPTQTMVDTYHCIDGLRIDQSTLYEPTNPYKNRDPRLEQSILRPGEWYNNFKFETHPDSTTTLQNVGGTLNRVNNLEVTNQYATFTGYHWKKYFDETELPTQVTRSELDFMLMRYAEVLLTYAEAKIELGDIDQTVIDAINEVRGRPSVQMPLAQANASQQELRKLVRYERTVELALEGFRFFDIRRWRIAEDVLPGNMLGRRTKAHWFDEVIPTFNAVGKPAYNNERQIFQILSTNTFDPGKHYLWPVPQRELDLNPTLGQNPGWR
ncbi:RagB/SusD family nutrient uptake outer membrane protein [Sphingobacterium haloxyli]|nr:RagB/SusD family nutrient uptake outer membrane protein [Sphingobacterium haloxyli]